MHWRPCRNIAMTFIMQKLEWCGYTMARKLCKYVYSFWRNVQVWQTRGQTDTAWRHRQWRRNVSQWDGQQWDGCPSHFLATDCILHLWLMYRLLLRNFIKLSISFSHHCLHHYIFTRVIQTS